MFKALKNLFVLQAHAARTIADDPLLKSKFRVTIAGLPTGMGFQKVGGLSSETEVVEYVEGGYQNTHKLPGRDKVGEVTLERGTYASDELRSYYKKTLTSTDIRSTVTIESLDNLGNVKKTYKLAEAWASKWEGSDFDAGSNDVAIEKITLQFEYFLD
jgi:phage tail-like protein